MFCLEDLCKDSPTIPAEPAPEFTRNALPNALLSHTSLLVALTPVWCCWCPEWRISACLLPQQLWQPGSQEITQIISTSQLAQATRCLRNHHRTTAKQGTILLNKLCHSRSVNLPSSSPALPDLVTPHPAHLVTFPVWILLSRWTGLTTLEWRILYFLGQRRWLGDFFGKLAMGTTTASGHGFSFSVDGGIQAQSLSLDQESSS